MTGADADPFRCLLRVRYGECDAQGVVFNPRYGEYVEVVVTEFVRALGFGDDFVAGRLDYQLVRQTIEWRAPARFDDVIAAGVRAVHIGNTSFRLGVDFARADDGAALASAETVYVVVDSALRKRAVPEAFRGALEAGAPGIETDLAAWCRPADG